VSKTTEIRGAVESELSFDPMVDDSNVAVKNLNGQATLTGAVPSYPQYLEAERAAKRVAGVTSVHNYLKVVLPPEDYRDDALLTIAANDALAGDVTVPAGVRAMASNGNLTLTGSVISGTQREAAERAVGALPACATSRTRSWSATLPTRGTSTSSSRGPWTVTRWSGTTFR
jgi:osmotically-inducible protein OsmY